MLEDMLKSVLTWLLTITAGVVVLSVLRVPTSNEATQIFGWSVTGLALLTAVIIAWRQKRQIERRGALQLMTAAALWFALTMCGYTYLLGGRFLDALLLRNSPPLFVSSAYLFLATAIGLNLGLAFRACSRRK